MSNVVECGGNDLAAKLVKKVIAKKLLKHNDIKKDLKDINNDNIMKNNMSEKSNIVNFLRSLSEKNYAQANKYLVQIMQDKISSRIATQGKGKLF